MLKKQMEDTNGIIKKVNRRSKEQTMDMGSNNSYSRTWYFWLILLCLLNLTGCSTLKPALITGAVTTAAGATNVLAPGASVVPAVIGGATAATASALTAASPVKGEPIEVQAETFVQEAPDNFWTLLGKLTKVGGWALILVIIVPMLFSWLMPGPIQFKGKKKK